MPAGSTQPMSTSSTSSLFRPALFKASAIAIEPSFGAATSANAPWKAPIGVRTADATTTSRDMGASSLPFVAGFAILDNRRRRAHVQSVHGGNMKKIVVLTIVALATGLSAGSAEAKFRWPWES